ncbi:hypothetical protein [Agreia sp. Leaf335]|uniref:hypothetical protein n=1 Tax=Agreia sp. Leaf335 TaxID=1736340 RepID=UPI000ABA42B0|nr:hypothetical protein [Agreia sp. Leaf335]
MVSTRLRSRFQQSLRRRPLLLAFWSALFLVASIWICNEHGWNPLEDIGTVRHGPLWIIMIGLPLWAFGIVLGVGRAVSGFRERRRVKSAAGMRQSADPGVRDGQV